MGWGTVHPRMGGEHGVHADCLELDAYIRRYDTAFSLFLLAVRPHVLAAV